jgi:hypothetical protein
LKVELLYLFLSQLRRVAMVSDLPKVCLRARAGLSVSRVGEQDLLLLELSSV